MPWCEECSKFWSPNSLPPTGECPSCGRTLAMPSESVEAVDDDYKAPWHFKLMVLFAAVYLGWRVVQMVGWLV